MPVAPSSRGTRCFVVVLLATLAATVAWAVVPDPLEPAAPETFSESIDVALFTSIVRVVPARTDSTHRSTSVCVSTSRG